MSLAETVQGEDWGVSHLQIFTQTRDEAEGDELQEHITNTLCSTRLCQLLVLQTGIK